MADRSGSRKHKWSSPAEMSPSKYLRGLDSKLPRSAHHSRERDSESLSPPRERQVTICPYESTPKRTLNLGAGGSSKERLQSRGHPSSDYHRSDRQATSTQRISVSEGDRRVEMDEDAKAKSADVPRSRERRPHAPSLLFKRAFSDILGVSSRERRSLVGQTMSPSDTERRSRFQRRDSTSSEASPKMGTPEDQIEEEKPSRRWDSADRPIRLHRTITRDLPKEEPEVCKEKTDTPVREVEEEKPPRRRDAEDHQIRINRTIAREFPKEEAKVCKEKSKSLPTNIVEGKPAESADHQLRRPIKRVFANEEPEVHKGKSTHSEPIQRAGDSKNVIVEEEPSGSKEHPVRVRKSITRADPNEEPEAHREKSRHSEPSSRTRTTSKNEEAKLSWRSEIGDHPIRLKGAIEKAVPKKESEAYKGTSRDSDPSPRTGTSKNEDVKPSRRSESGDHPIRLKGAIERAVPIKESEAYKGTSRGTDPSPRTGSSKNKDVKPSRRSESADHPVKLKRSMKKAVPKEEPEVPADIPRLVFLYESDKESDASDHLEKNPSIGSDFSDIDDMGTLARFSQEDAPLQDGAPTPSCLRHPQQLYSRPFNSHTDLWPTSPMYKPSTEQNKWRQDDLNKSCLSEVSVNTERSRMTSSDSEDEDEKRPGRTESFYTQWILNETTKAPRRTLDFPPASDCNTPKFLREGFIDTHCHLDMLFSRLQHKRSFADLRHQYSSTFPSEFQGCITDYCDPRTLERLPWRHVLNEKMVWGAFGCHPHFAQYYTNELQEDMMQAMRHPKAIAYGEMGLDYSHKCSTTIPDQHAVFEKQLKLAVPLGKPLVIHCRDADEDLFRIMKKWVPPDYKIHRHCFTGDYKVIEPFLHEFPNMSVGFTAVLTYPSAVSAREAVTRIPLDRLIIETDAPFFVPRQVPKSLCKFSHPGLALHTVQEVARLKNLPLRSVMAKVRENTHRLYNI